ncbi:cell division regulator GpsB [Fructilactobacillus vespulae]|uniref:cell division regulator GpsB n=1 Tax=Fructilactobacillus vespulae TaxID=1249630 RepID=UPI0039B6B581
MDEIKFTPKDILQKEFKQKMRGYDPTDVDSFLDEVIKDYENFNKVVSNKDQELSQLHSENQQLKSKIISLENDAANNTVVNKSDDDLNSRLSRQEQPMQDSQLTNVSNMDILKRLSKLERKVFGDNSIN